MGRGRHAPPSLLAMGNQLLRKLGCLELMGSSGYGYGEQAATVVNTKRKRPRLGKDGLAEADQTNRLLDKWRPSDVRQLMRAFKSSIAAARAEKESDGDIGGSAATATAGAAATASASGKISEHMGVDAFLKVFTGLDALPESIAKAFASSTNKRREK